MQTEELHIETPRCQCRIAPHAVYCQQQDNAPHLVLDKSSQRKVIKQVCEELPDIGVAILAQALIIKAVAAEGVHRVLSARVKGAASMGLLNLHLRDLPAFVIASQDCDSLTISDFQSNQKGHCLY